jgi:hypothetical protein
MSTDVATDERFGLLATLTYTVWAWRTRPGRWQAVARVRTIAEAECIRDRTGGIVLRAGEGPPQYVPPGLPLPERR